MCDVGVVCEQDGVVGHHWIAGGQNAPCHMADTVQDAVIHQEVVHQQLRTQTDTQTAARGSECEKKRDCEAHSREKTLPQIPLLPCVASLSSSTV